MSEIDDRERKRAKARENTRAWVAANPEKNRARARAWAATNREKARERSRAWAAAHPEGHRAWRAAHPEHAKALYRASSAKRRASIKTNVGEAPTAQQLATILKSPCHYCGDPAEHVDHYIPLARGGAHTLDNLVPACAPCNRSKGAKLPGTEWKGRAPGAKRVIQNNEQLKELRAATELVRSKLGSKDDDGD